jgi:hypothetical protein
MIPPDSFSQHKCQVCHQPSVTVQLQRLAHPVVGREDLFVTISMCDECRMDWTEALFAHLPYEVRIELIQRLYTLPSSPFAL